MKSYEEIINEVSSIETKQIGEKISIDEFKGKNILTYGTYDLFHIGHKKIIDHAIELTGDQSNVYVGVSSDDWNLLKNKKAEETHFVRMENIKKNYPNINVILEDHKNAEETWPAHWDEFSIDLIVMGGDHVESLSYINGQKTPKGSQMKIAFYERTPKISSTLIRKQKEVK